VALEFRIVRSDGAERWLYLRGEMQAGRERGAQRLVSTVLDITERKHAELLLEQQYREKDEFLSFISHELRTPLTAIKGYANLLLGGECGELSVDQEDSLRIIQRNADHMVSLIDDLLNLLHLESGKMKLEFSLVLLAPLLEQVVATFRPQFMAKQQRVLLELSHQLPSIVADASRLAQVFTNLISNAHKYTPEGGQITLRAWREDDQVFVAVADSGVGISPEDQAQLFTKFFRAKHHLVRSERGTGLGLAISRQLVELHGGRIAVTSAPDRGSTFMVSLPLLPKGAASGEVGISGKAG
jgi:signal transduction histidine kinase